jgi:DNA-binding NtrC family response regulator
MFNYIETKICTYSIFTTIQSNFYLMKKIKLLIVEDNRLLREGITALVKEQPDMIVTAALGTRENILKKIKTLNPNIVLLDMGLPHQNSMQLVKKIIKDFPEFKVIEECKEFCVNG